MPPGVVAATGGMLHTPCGASTGRGESISKKKAGQRVFKNLRLPIEMGVDLSIKMASTREAITHPVRGTSVGG